MGSKIMAKSGQRKMQFGNLAVGVDVTRYDDTAVYTLGETAEGEDGKRYRYVKFVDAVTYAAAKIVVLASATTWDVTIDMAGGSALANLNAVGMCLGVPTEDQFGWVQFEGIATFTAGSSGIIAGDELMPDSEDGDLTEAAGGTDENICAVSLAVVADNATGLCMLRHMA